MVYSSNMVFPHSTLNRSIIIQHLPKHVSWVNHEINQPQGGATLLGAGTPDPRDAMFRQLLIFLIPVAVLLWQLAGDGRQ